MAPRSSAFRFSYARCRHAWAQYRRRRPTPVDDGNSRPHHRHRTGPVRPEARPTTLVARGGRRGGGGGQAVTVCQRGHRHGDDIPAIRRFAGTDSQLIPWRTRQSGSCQTAVIGLSGRQHRRGRSPIGAGTSVISPGWRTRWSPSGGRSTRAIAIWRPTSRHRRRPADRLSRSTAGPGDRPAGAGRRAALESRSGGPGSAAPNRSRCSPTLLEELPDARFNIDAKAAGAVGPLVDLVIAGRAPRTGCAWCRSPIGGSPRFAAALRPGGGTPWAPREIFRLVRARPGRRRVRPARPSPRRCRSASAACRSSRRGSRRRRTPPASRCTSGRSTIRVEMRRLLDARRRRDHDRSARTAFETSWPSGVPGRDGDGGRRPVSPLQCPAWTSPTPDGPSALSAVPAAGSGRGRFAGGTVKFFHGPMDCGKSTLALQLHYNHSRQGRRGLLLTKQDRSGPARISSRIGISRTAVEVSDEQDIAELVRAESGRTAARSTT